MAVSTEVLSRRFDPAELRGLAEDLLQAAGLPAQRAESMARLLVLTDMMGRTTHGLAQCKAYLDELAAGRMQAAGNIEIVVDKGANTVWDGHYLPGLWLTESAINQAFERVPQYGTVTHVIRRSHHIGCLAALVKSAADRGLFALLMSSGPHGRYVAPYGGTQGLFSPNPLAVGFPAGDSPVLIDISASITTASKSREMAQAGEYFQHDWMLDDKGRASKDPRYLEEHKPRGSLMLLGGIEAGHKGFGLALMVEAMTQGLGGFGRLDAPTRWGASVFLQIIDPDAFAGRQAFQDQMSHFASQCRANPPADPALPVRLPGDQAERNIQRCLREGVPLSPTTIEQLRQSAVRLNVAAHLLADAD